MAAEEFVSRGTGSPVPGWRVKSSPSSGAGVPALVGELTPGPVSGDEPSARAGAWTSTADPPALDGPPRSCGVHRGPRCSGVPAGSSVVVPGPDGSETTVVARAVAAGPRSAGVAAENSTDPPDTEATGGADAVGALSPVIGTSPGAPAASVAWARSTGCDVAGDGSREAETKASAGSGMAGRAC